MRILKQLFILPFILIAASCEKHDGEMFFKAKCEVEHNGKTYIDQTRFETIMSPNATATPYLKNYSYKNFSGFQLSVEAAPARNEQAVLFIDIYINGIDDYRNVDLVGTSFLISFDESFLSTDSQNPFYGYIDHCYDNGISYGRIISWENRISCIASQGILTFSRKDPKSGTYDGTFRLTTSEGEYVGRFYNL